MSSPERIAASPIRAGSPGLPSSPALASFAAYLVVAPVTWWLILGAWLVTSRNDVA